jgi:integrase
MRDEHAVDIHNYQRQIANAERAVRKSALSKRNKQLIFGYRDACLRQSICGQVRLIRVLGALTLLGRQLGKDFDKVTKADLERLISRLLRATPPYSPETIGTYKAILKKFMTWVIDPATFPTKTPPSMVAWITCHVRAKDKRRLQRRDLLTPEEAGQLLCVCDNPRDRALVSLLWETGARIAEIGNLQVKHVTKHPHGYLLDVDGKTGGRNPLVVGSAHYLSAWLAYHPFATNPEAPLWVYQHYQPTPRYVRYQAIRKILITLFARAHINKRPNPHGLRHARTTHLIGSGLMTGEQARVYLGWSPNSTMLGTYAHLTTSDANNAILAENHVTTPTPQPTGLVPRPCPICQEANPPSAPFCVRCNNALDEAAAHRAHNDEQRTQALIRQLCEVLVKKGLLDEAALTIHDAGLGPALARLAKPDEPQPPAAGTSTQ